MKPLLKLFCFLPLLIISFTEVYSKKFDSVAIYIGNKALTANEITLAVAQAREERRFLRQPELPPDELKRQVIKSKIDILLLLNRAEELQIEANQNEINAQVEKYKKENKLNETAFETALKSQNYSLKQFNKIQEEGIIRQKVISREIYSKIDITGLQIKKAYEAEVGGKVYKVRHLLRQVPVNATEEQKKKAKDNILYVIDQIKKGSSFEELVKDYSEDPGAPQNKGILEFELNNAIAPLREAVLKLKPGEYSGIVQTEFGFHLVRLLEIKKAAQKPFEEVKNQIRERLFKQKYDSLLKQLYSNLKKRYKIVFLDKSLKTYYVSTES